MLNQLSEYDLSGEHDGQFLYLNDIFEFQRGQIRKRAKNSELCWAQHWFQLEGGWKTHLLGRDVHGFKEIVSCLYTSHHLPIYIITIYYVYL